MRQRRPRRGPGGRARRVELNRQWAAQAGGCRLGAACAVLCRAEDDALLDLDGDDDDFLTQARVGQAFVHAWLLL